MAIQLLMHNMAELLEDMENTYQLLRLLILTSSEVIDHGMLIQKINTNHMVVN